MSDAQGVNNGAKEIDRVGIVGGGIMGSGIAEVCARAGLAVHVVETDGIAAGGARDRIRKSLERAEAAGKEPDAKAAFERITVTDQLNDLHGVGLVIEAIVEDRDAKIDLFSRLAGLFGDDQPILATNTSSVPIVELAAATGELAPRVLGLHFFNPVPVMKLVEVIPSLLTDPGVMEEARRFAADVLYKEVIEAPDRAGFTVNALLIPYLLSAIRMYEQGLATAEDIDTGMVRGCGHPMGPLRLSDLIGLDTVMSVAETLHREHRDIVFAPPPLLQRMVSADLLGRKSGRGFFEYA
ncbi:MAG: 3-hydroxybutyryl-CoA dehydrogenase [Actinomycetota bacterium]|nr:3-hydroxybutyryl-CoA dehydrogenase [Actinomycetota bacterium]